MADKELRRLKRRDLLRMLLAQCEETERLQRESDEAKAELALLSESYERLKIKLNVKDERLNQKDVKIAELNRTIREMKESKAIELEKAGSIAEAALQLNGIFELAQQCADQYLMNVKRLAGEAEAKPSEPEGGTEGKQISFEAAWRAKARRRQEEIHAKRSPAAPAEAEALSGSVPLASSGDLHG